jgi:hypothetical protein
VSFESEIEEQEKDRGRKEQRLEVLETSLVTSTLIPRPEANGTHLYLPVYSVILNPPQSDCGAQFLQQADCGSKP